MCVSNNSIEKGNKRRMGRTKLIEYFFQLLQSFLNGPTPASFIVYFWSFQTNIITIFTTIICEQMSIQYTVLGFEHMTFGTWVSSHNHLTEAPARNFSFFVYGTSRKADYTLA